MPERDDIYGLLGEFDNSAGLLEAARRLRSAGYRRFDAYTPFPIDGLAEAIGFRERALPYVAIIGGAAGGLGVLLLQYYLNAVDYPINVGGRPLASWPAFAVPAFESLVLGAVLALLGGMLALNGLPRLNHPLFNVDRFHLASTNRYFACVEATDPRFHPRRTRTLLESLGARHIQEVPR